MLIVITTTKFHSTLAMCDKHISYICFRENVLKGLQNIGAEVKFFVLHSIWAGSSTDTANLGVNDRFDKNIKMEIRQS